MITRMIAPMPKPNPYIFPGNSPVVLVDPSARQAACSRGFEPMSLAVEVQDRCWKYLDE